MPSSDTDRTADEKKEKPKEHLKDDPNLVHVCTRHFGRLVADVYAPRHVPSGEQKELLRRLANTMSRYILSEEEATSANSGLRESFQGR